ncbi:MAG: ribosome assembly RNA-binding protein YhbY [Spirochaetes bacterium]|nr:ribosome assembly RNA-binding protein YhbY [Spirochaetota bacterium]
MKPLTGKQIRKLKSLAHHLEPVVYIGKQGITPALVKAADDALRAHELIKIKFVDFKDAKKSLAEEVAAETDAVIIGMIGNVAILFRQNPDAGNQRIVV